MIFLIIVIVIVKVAVSRKAKSSKVATRVPTQVETFVASPVRRQKDNSTRLYEARKFQVYFFFTQVMPKPSAFIEKFISDYESNLRSGTMIPGYEQRIDFIKDTDELDINEFEQATETRFWVRLEQIKPGESIDTVLEYFQANYGPIDKSRIIPEQDSTTYTLAFFHLEDARAARTYHGPLGSISVELSVKSEPKILFYRAVLHCENPEAWPIDTLLWNICDFTPRAEVPYKLIPRNIIHVVSIQEAKKICIFFDSHQSWQVFHFAPKWFVDPKRPTLELRVFEFYSIKLTHFSPRSVTPMTRTCTHGRLLEFLISSVG